MLSRKREAPTYAGTLRRTRRVLAAHTEQSPSSAVRPETNLAVSRKGNGRHTKAVALRFASP